MEGEASQMLHVASQQTEDVLYSAMLGGWFGQSLLARTAWHASNAKPTLGGLQAEAHFETVASEDDGYVSEWLVTLSVDGQIVFRCRWPVSIFESTALAVAQQVQPAFGDGRVIYWVSREPMGHSSCGAAARIEFDGEPSETVVFPAIPTRQTPPRGKLLAASSSSRADAILLLHQQALSEVSAGVAACEATELAWAGAAERWRYADASSGYQPLVYELRSLHRLASPDATATLCPVSADELARVYPVAQLQQGQSFVFVHSHVCAPDLGNVGPGNGFLAPSQDDIRMMHRLPIGSLGLIVAGAPPLRLRALGWPWDGSDLSELAIAVMLAEPSA